MKSNFSKFPMKLHLHHSAAVMRRMLSFVLFLSMLLTLCVSAEATAYVTTHFEEDFKKIKEPADWGAELSGSVFSYIGAQSCVKIVTGDDAINIAQSRAVPRSLAIKECDMRLWNMNINNLTMAFSFSLKFQKSADAVLTFSITTQDKSTSNGGTDGWAIRFTDGEDGVVLTDRSETVSTVLAYDTAYQIGLEFSRGTSQYVISVNEEAVGTGTFLSKVYEVNACRFDAASCDLVFDDFLVRAWGRESPQQYSMQEPGEMPEIAVPSYYESPGLQAYVNAPSGITQIDVAEEDGIAYVPLQAFLDAAGITEDTGIREAESLSVTRGEDLWISTAAVNALCGAKVWWDDAEEMIVLSVGSRIDDGILRTIDGRLYMDGEPYYEISFNKFDLAYQITNAFFDYANGEFTEGDMLALAEDALKTLHDNGFRTIRFFCTSIVSGADILHDPEKKATYYAAFDYLFDLCDKYEIKAVVNLMLNNALYLHVIEDPDAGWVLGDETVYDMIADPDSQSRASVLAYIEEFVGRYKDRDCILMWEISNEINLDADVGINVDAMRNSLLQIGAFYQDAADKIRAVDPEHLVTSGDAIQRESSWNLLSGTMAGSESANWTKDTWGERLKVLSVLNEGMDVVSTHIYDAAENGDLPTDADTDKTAETDMLSLALAVKEARALGKPLYLGECGIKQSVIDHRDQDAITPYQEQYLQQIIDAGIQLTHWWTFHSDRAAAFNDDYNWNVEPGTHDASFALIKAANEQLKETYLINRAEADNVYTPETARLNAGTNEQVQTDTGDVSSDTGSSGSGADSEVKVNTGIVAVIAAVVVIAAIVVVVVLRRTRKNKS